ncbi:MAG: hypothetical protein AUG52_10255 [Verrucomicrobia bacterium 13_1_20CM_3_54_17]|nr:MAG: hypothetical protein AUG52_10255 [Verrucomicrobia bacterium 13_1_20CM_3_54_17]
MLRANKCHLLVLLARPFRMAYSKTLQETIFLCESARGAFDSTPSSSALRNRYKKPRKKIASLNKTASIGANA